MVLYGYWQQLYGTVRCYTAGGRTISSSAPLSQPCVEGGLSRADSLSYDGPRTDIELGFMNGYGIRSHERIWD